MEIIVNGAPRDLPADATVSGLLRELGVSARGVAVERNLAIVPRSQFDQTVLAGGDRIEIVSFVGGG